MAEKTPLNDREIRIDILTTTEIVAVMVGTEITRRDIIISRRDQIQQSVAVIHRSYDVLQY